MGQPITRLSGLIGHGGRIRVECRACCRVAYFVPAELVVYFRGKRWPDEWSEVPRRLRCRCGERNPKISWQFDDPPPLKLPKPRAR